MNERDEKLNRLKAHYRRNRESFEKWRAAGYPHYAKPSDEPLPHDLADMRCEANTRAGTPCKRKDIYSNGRCKHHGGMSTGAQTPEGKARQLEGYRRWQESRKQAAIIAENMP